MKYFEKIYILFILLLLLGCEKSIVNEDDSVTVETESSVTSESKEVALSVSEAQGSTEGIIACVKGFIVAATHNNIGNADFSAPFEGSTALVLASRQSNGTASQFSKDELFPVCLTDAASGLREQYNLQAHPEYYNQYVYIKGTREAYMRLAGLKHVTNIEIDPSHVVSNDEQPDAIDDTANEQEEKEEEQEEEEEEEEQEEEAAEDSTETTSYLTVAEAIAATEGVTCTVQGYIVAALTRSKKNICFDYPDFNNYKTSIVLADKPYDSSKSVEEQYGESLYDQLLIVYLGDCKPTALKNELNLTDHEDNQNKLVQITGTIGFYYGMETLIKVTGYQFVNQ